MLATQVLPEDTLNDTTEDESEIVGHLVLNNERHNIRRGENKIGRDPCCSIVIENCTISKLHAIIESDGRDDTFIYDCGSTNLTKLKKTKLKPHCRYKLEDKTDIVLGNVTATFILAEEVSYPELKTIPVNTQALDELEDIFDLPTQVPFFKPDNFKSPSNHCKKEIENSEIFNLTTQCQLPNLTQNGSTEKVNSLLDDGHDDVLCNFMSQQSPKCGNETEVDIFDVPTQADAYEDLKEKETEINDAEKDTQNDYVVLKHTNSSEDKLTVKKESKTDEDFDEVFTQRFELPKSEFEEFSDRIESILTNGFKDEKPESSDGTVSDLEVDDEKSFAVEEKPQLEVTTSSQNSNESYTFELDPKRPAADSDVTDCEIEVNKEKSPSRCWSPLSLVMPSTQDVKQFLQRENQVGDEVKRNRRESIDESPAKKPKTEKSTQDLSEVQPMRTRYSLRTPNTNKQSCRRSTRGRKSNPEITPYLIRCRRKTPTCRFYTPGRKRRSKYDIPVVAFTGFESAKLDKIIDELGGGRTYELSGASVVVTDKVRRTVKFLCAVGLGLPITSPDWLLTSKKEKKFLNPTNFILRDEEAEDKWSFDLKSSLERSKRVKLLEGYNVYATKSTKPPVKDLLAIVECCGGTPIVHKPTTWPRRTIIVSCEEDKEAWPPPRVRNIKLVHYEFILTGVLRQKIDFKSHSLR